MTYHIISEPLCQLLEPIGKLTPLLHLLRSEPSDLASRKTTEILRLRL
jgi:hypothetical protein